MVQANVDMDKPPVDPSAIPQLPLLQEQCKAPVQNPATKRRRSSTTATNPRVHHGGSQEPNPPRHGRGMGQTHDHIVTDDFSQSPARKDYESELCIDHTLPIPNETDELETINETPVVKRIRTKYKSVNESNFKSDALTDALKNKTGIGRRVARKRAWSEMCTAMVAMGCYVNAGYAPQMPGPPQDGPVGNNDGEQSRKRQRADVHVEKSTVGQQLKMAKGDLRKLWGAPDADG